MSVWLSRVTGRRRPAPLGEEPEPAETRPPLEPVGVSLMRTPEPSEGAVPCGERVGGHFLDPEGRCYYGCEDGAA